MPLQYGYAQKKPITDYSKIITTKKILLKFQDQTDSLMIPVVSDKYPGLKNALCDTSLFFGERLDTVVNQYQTNGTGITAFNYNITYINGDVVSLRLYSETMGAYPDQQTQSLTLNIHTGKAYPINKEISAAGLKWAYTSYKKLLKKRIDDDKSEIVAAKENKKDSDEMGGYIGGEENIDDIYGDLSQSADDLTMDDLVSNYIFTDKGVLFTTEPRLAHAVRNFEPERDWIVSYKKLKSFKLPGAIVLK
ncbi:MAG TPA: hypothetical protein VK668_00070 [Mucilaginibacter sp.]|nr:hypothetical protein [Mucilaginibacter sp.]